MTLKEKVILACDKFNNGEVTTYAELMIRCCIEAELGVENYFIESDIVYRMCTKENERPLAFHLSHLVGMLVLKSNPDFLEEDYYIIKM
jgi:hypothetical protein